MACLSGANGGTMNQHNRETAASAADEWPGTGASEADARPDRTVENAPDPTEAGASSADVGMGADATEARLEAEKADLTDRLVRLAADMENLRRRTERDVQDARRYAVQRFAADVLVVGDNLKRALDAAGAEAAEGFVEGVEMTSRELARVLEKHGVKRIEADGQRFDPHLHQAMFEVPDPSVAAGTVVQTMQEGYTIGDRVLRAAMVGVSKGGPKAGEPAA